MRSLHWWPKLCLALILASAASAEDRWTDDFSHDLGQRWRVGHGEWKVHDGVLLHVHKDSPAHDYIVADFPFSEGMIEVKGIARKKNSYQFASLGIVIKHIDDKNQLWFRFGSYNHKNLYGPGLPAFQRASLGVGQPDLGRKYDLTVIVRNGLIGISIDDVMIGVLRDPYSGKPGRSGIFSESGAEFDDFRVTRWK
jgi:hypothetical protein